ncbi:hypothetical protein [Candidatus Igneacidithiobacillus taiwanensis]|uniref:hypothetical protein n=1 Tax=Candidatus Igneacidithiobacillus taiwanensis TaxID=1945924 RepID=UPI00289F2072|nr:hypothetical protein [Candidatus Igneacidithiobacillus taiwanensis]MCE5360904.1 hypothetical protein [Acidithiobacillus sp.]
MSAYLGPSCDGFVSTFEERPTLTQVLAWRIAAGRVPHEMTRAQAMESEEFKEQFAAAKEYLKSLAVGYVKINNPLVLYVFEPYCAMEFETAEWNTFETH